MSWTRCVPVDAQPCGARRSPRGTRRRCPAAARGPTARRRGRWPAARRARGEVEHVGERIHRQNRTDRARHRAIRMRRTDKNRALIGHSQRLECTYGRTYASTKEPSWISPPPTPVVTGAARGLGRHLVDAAARARRAEGLRARPRHRPRCGRTRGSCPSRFDLLDAGSIAAAARRAARRDAADQQRLHGGVRWAARRRRPTPCGARWPSTTTAPTRPSAPSCPVLEANGGGHIVNVLSLLSLASTPPMTGYSASKAAAHSLTQALRPVLAARGITRARRLPGRHRHRHGRRHRHPQDGAGAGRRRAARRPRRRPRRTSSPTPTPRRWRRPGGAIPRRSSARSRPRRERRSADRGPAPVLGRDVGERL